MEALSVGSEHRVPAGAGAGRVNQGCFPKSRESGMPGSGLDYGGTGGLSPRPESQECWRRIEAGELRCGRQVRDESQGY
jgi:hypothetical protein